MTSIRGAFESCSRCFVSQCSDACITRASWTPQQRKAFDREDEIQEAQEMGWVVPRSLFVDLNPTRRYHRKVEDLRGRWFGQLFVIDRATRGRQGWRSMAREWRAVCMCGREVVVSASRLLHGQHQCGRCANAQIARSRSTTRRFGGLLVSEIAQRAGLAAQTIRTRIRRGVPVSELGAPRKRPPTFGNRRTAA